MFGKKKKQYILEVGGIQAEVTRKNIRNLNIRVYAAERKVKISAPLRATDRMIRNFAESRMEWVHGHFRRQKELPVIKELDFVSGDEIPVFGETASLEVVPRQGKTEVFYNEKAGRLKVYIRPAYGKERRKKAVKEWYRKRLKTEIPLLIQKYEGPMGVEVAEFGVKQMKTRWGTCNIRDRRIWLNLHLAEYPAHCLEYVVVHEMAHLKERLHTKRFYRIVEEQMPAWKETEDYLNRFSLRPRID